MIKDKMMTGLKNESKKMTVLENDYKTDDVLIAGDAELLARGAEVEGVGVVEAGRQHVSQELLRAKMMIMIIFLTIIIIIIIFAQEPRRRQKKQQSSVASCERVHQPYWQQVVIRL